MFRFFLAFALSASMAGSAARAATPTVRLVEFDTEVTYATATRILDAIDAAERESDDLVLIELDTPGGDLAALEEIVKRMLAAKVPTAVWVGPSGARAASAGFLILLAADVSTMAPGTRTGAASAVYGSKKSEEGDVLLKKVTNDLAGLARTIAEHRGRDVEKAAQAVLSADVYTDGVALESGLIDLVAPDRETLLKELDGRSVRRFDGTETTLHLAEARVVRTERTRWDALLEDIATPLVASILFMIGVGGLWFEFQNPGTWVPGIVGAVSLFLFALAANVLPFSILGLAVIVVGLVLFLLEVKFVSHGLLSIGGFVCLVVGGLMLFPGPIPELRLGLGTVLPGALVLAAFCLLAVRLTVKAHRGRVATGMEGLAGELATVADDLGPEGKVFVHGELWDATSDRGPIPRGRKVRVVRVENMMLHVEPADGSARGEVA